MKTTIVTVLFTVLMCFVSAAAFAAEPIGQIVYIEGIVDLQRDGEILELWDSDIGLEVYNYDLIETGYDGFAEIEITSHRTRGTLVKVDSDTAFYFDSAKMNGASKTNMTMMSGSLSFKVQKLTGNEELNVRTESAVMGVRGTEFNIQRAPEGSVLVTCVEGKVACEDDRRMERYAMPGSVVEKRSGSSLSRVDIDVGDENLYGAYWIGKREEIFRSGADTFIKGYSAQYNNYLPRFLEAYDNLLAVKSQLETYGLEENQGGGGFSSKMITVKAETSDEMIMMRSILPLFEHSYYAVQVLERYHQQGIGRTMIDKNYSSDDFFEEFSRRKLEIKNKLADVRYCIKLYMNISRAANPGGLDAPSFFDDMMMGANPLGAGSMPESSMPASRF
ncbi:MAG: FecR family protein [Spirochaetales bacterium]|uniref:FecR family protein n=1 Tax=Candidatus Thalassospirochaeta sargassi TaxID=3119039 RepID=A0AAJ1ILN8_9SPIO|nr:FecR family protein [Spirochaetales bacterium]